MPFSQGLLSYSLALWYFHVSNLTSVASAALLLVKPSTRLPARACSFADHLFLVSLGVSYASMSLPDIEVVSGDSLDLSSFDDQDGSSR